MRLRNFCLTAAAAVALTACGDDPLSVENLDAPDVERSYSTPDGIEAILRTSFAQILGATHGTTGALWVQSQVLSFESYGSVANFGMNIRAALPRIGVENQPGNQNQAEHIRDFAELSKRGRQVANGLRALDQLVAGAGSLGSPAQNARARAFGFFTLALANGELALMYDSVAVSTHLLTSDSIPELVGYAEGMETALAQLDSAIAVANAPVTGSGGFPLDNTWLRTMDGETTRAEFVQIARSLKARLRASVARTPAERAAVDWAAVVADAAAGITADVTLDLSSTLGWGVPWLSQMAESAGWHTMPLVIIGMADTSGAYRAWLGQPVGSRQQFNIRTPDKRFPSDNLGAATADAVRAAQVANSPTSAAILPDIYFRNRPPTEDGSGDAWANSPYEYYRFRNYRAASSTGPWIWMAKAEIDMLRAEGLLRAGPQQNVAGALALINASRTANGLAAYPAGSTLDTPAPGGAACVPQVPVGPSFTTTECGKPFEAMKWEKRIETAQTGYAQWFLDSRGWGDLAEGTSYMWPVPFQEMQARQKPFYNSPWQAPLGTYGVK